MTVFSKSLKISRAVGRNRLQENKRRLYVPNFLSLRNSRQNGYQNDNQVTKVNVEPFGDPNQGKSMIRLNLNMNLEVENGKPQKMTLPQGDLMLMFVPNTR